MSASLSIGIVCFPAMGGSGVVASDLAAGLAERGHDVHLLATARPGRLPPDSGRLRFHVVRVPEYPVFPHAPYTPALASSIAEVSRTHRLDVVQVHYAVPHAVSAYLARQMLGPQAPRIVTSLHGTDVTRVGPDPSYRSITSFAVAASDAITVPSDFLRQQAREQLDLASALPIEVVPNFVDTDHFSPASRRDPTIFDALFPSGGERGPVLFHVSTFRQIKRVGDLIEMLARVRQHVPARLVLVGDGPQREHAQAQADALGLQDSVRFLGRRTDFIELLRQADVFVLASESESFGVAALEALSTGIPVCAYRVGGLPEVVSDDVGRLVTPLDVDALAQAVIEVVTSPETRDSLGHAARARVLTRFRRAPAIEHYESIFRRLVEGGRSETA